MATLSRAEADKKYDIIKYILISLQEAIEDPSTKEPSPQKEHSIKAGYMLQNTELAATGSLQEDI